jgi:hypothetical protein
MTDTATTTNSPYGRDSQGVGLITWGEFAMQEPELASFGAERLTAAPAYLATTQASDVPRVHPVTPIVTTDGLFVFMEPSSPKGQDLRERPCYALHNGVPDNHGSGGQFFVRGHAFLVEDKTIRALVAHAAPYDPAERYILFELTLTGARCIGYGDTPLPVRQQWPATS